MRKYCVKFLLVSATLVATAIPLWADQTVVIDGNAGGSRFDGIGAVSGGGGTSVLLKDYPEPQRGQILDLLFKPQFGASLSALYVEVGGDGNSTQGSELSHMHSKNDENYRRGYEWWLMKEAKTRNPDLSLDACGWSCPGWIGNGNFYSQDMCDYYARWIKGLRDSHGLKLDALGCRNERGVHEAFAKMLRRTLDREGLGHVLIHGFDNWEKNKWDWAEHLRTDPELAQAINVLGNHTLGNVAERNGPTPDSVKALAAEMHKPIWDTEEHVYLDGYDCEIAIVQSFNLNYLQAGATKVVNWYLEDSTYGIEPYKVKPGMLIADSPWSGHYQPREALWGYAHYGQFTKIGWSYQKSACGRLDAGGTFITLKSPGPDYSVILETRGAKVNQTVTFHPAAGPSQGNLCVWRSNKSEQFVRQADLVPASGNCTLTLEPDSIYSLSTTTGQQKGGFDSIPKARPFPFPYRETFEQYAAPADWGYLPHYTADIAGAFEIAPRADGKGRCLRQVTDRKAQNWGSEWMPLTILGDAGWKDYECGCDVLLENAGWAGLMGRVSQSSGKDHLPRGYFLQLAADGRCTLYSTVEGKKDCPFGRQLATYLSPDKIIPGWHNLKLRFSGEKITALLDGVHVLDTTDKDCAQGMMALVTGDEQKTRSTACFDDVIIKPVDAQDPPPTPSLNVRPLYSALVTVTGN